jgi:hypothetical protein
MMLLANVSRDFVFANNWEAGLWSTVAAALVFAFFHSRSLEKAIAVLAFGLFAVADWLDVRTVDTAWSPWLFFAIKVLCFATFAWLLWRFEHERRKHEASYH